MVLHFKMVSDELPLLLHFHIFLHFFSISSFSFPSATSGLQICFSVMLTFCISLVFFPRIGSNFLLRLCLQLTFTTHQWLLLTYVVILNGILKFPPVDSRKAFACVSMKEEKPFDFLRTVFGKLNHLFPKEILVIWL